VITPTPVAETEETTRSGLFDMFLTVMDA